MKYAQSGKVQRTGEEQYGRNSLFLVGLPPEMQKVIGRTGKLSDTRSSLIHCVAELDGSVRSRQLACHIIGLHLEVFEPETEEAFTMGFRKSVLTFIAILVATMFLLQFAACGTLIYPERQGQTNGRIDAGIAILDGLCLLLFIIPGVIAFAVDFSTGAIYLPSGKSKYTEDLESDGMVVVKVRPEKLNLAKLDEVIGDYTGEEITLKSDRVEIFEADERVSIEEQLRHWAQ